MDQYAASLIWNFCKNPTDLRLENSFHHEGTHSALLSEKGAHPYFGAAVKKKRTKIQYKLSK